MSGEKYRLVTRSDFDGLVCAVLLKELDLIDDIQFVHPKDMQDGKVVISGRDIITNLPFVPGAHLGFDHHASELARVGAQEGCIIDEKAPSAARVVYNYYGGKARFTNIPDDLMDAVDRSDSAQWTQDEVLEAKGWPLLSFIMDARTGLGRFHEFRISNYQLMMKMIDLIRTNTLDQLLADPDVVERTEIYFDHSPRFKDQLTRCGRQIGKVVVLDLRDEEVIYAGNRFEIYALFPTALVSIHVVWGRGKQNVVLACGRSILDRSSTVNIGELMLKHGGGGHAAAGTCQVDVAQFDAVLSDVVAALNG